MTTVQIELPDELVDQAKKAGLLTNAAIEALLRERLRKQVGEDLRAMWARVPNEELTPEIEQQVVDEVNAVRAERRAEHEKNGADRS